jgi:polyphosphate kinase
VSGLKTHSKAALVVRQEESGMRCYAHIATGNYHTRTARLYEDVGLLTTSPAVTRDVVTLFHFLTGRSRTPSFPTLLVAPMVMRDRFVELVEREIDLVVRGLCCLAPGVPGVTENIRIRSIVGRFLEHSRIFHFAAGSDDPLEGEFLIGSADWMHRNLSDRVEAAVPIVERRLRARLWEILEVCLADRRNAWQMQPDGSYVQLLPEEGDGPGSEGTHATMMRLALARHGAYN